MSERRPQARWTVSGASVAGLVAFVRAKGSSLDDVLARLGLDLEALRSPESRVEVAANDALWEEAERRTGDADLGLHFARRLDLDAFHLVGHLATISPTVGAALERVVQFSRLLHDAGRTELERHAGGEVSLYPGCRGLPRPPPRQVAEFNAASAVVLMRFVAAAPGLTPAAVDFHHPAPPAIDEHRRLFGVTPTFGALEDRLVFTEDTLAMPVRVSGPSPVGQYLERYAGELLARLGVPRAESLRDQVERLLVSGLSRGGLTLDAVAERLAMTPRTLQRRLADEDTTFGVVEDEVRRRAAERYLADGRLPLAEIAYLLGFSEVSTFHRAFRRWTGKTPGAFRG